MNRTVLALGLCALFAGPAAAHGSDARLNLVGQFIEGQVLPLEVDPLADAEVGEWVRFRVAHSKTGAPLGWLRHEVLETGPDHVLLEIVFEPVGGTATSQPRVMRHRYARGAARLDASVLEKLKTFNHRQHEPEGGAGEDPPAAPQPPAPTHQWEVEEVDSRPEVLESGEAKQQTTRLHFRAAFEARLQHRSLSKSLRLTRWISNEVPCLGWVRVERVQVLQVIGDEETEPLEEGYVGELEAWGTSPPAEKE